METLEVRARTVEEATNRALQQLGLGRDQVEVTVVREGRSGILGLGAEDAIVRVTPLAPEPESAVGLEHDAETVARDVLGELLRLLGISASIESQTSFGAQGDDEGPAPLALDIRGDDLGVLIGRRGQTLAALQYIVRLLVGRRMESWAPLVIDVESYKLRRQQALQSFAREMADRVKARGVPFTLEPMPPYERRVIHMALADYPGVTTESTGQGDERKVVIRPVRS
jgi:spoIIIJ-associated protein